MQIRSHLDGVVSMFYAEDGAHVEEDEKLLMIESMKMTFEIGTPVAGTVYYKCQLGQVVKRTELLAEVI